jgi:hypothetical protein
LALGICFVQIVGRCPTLASDGPLALHHPQIPGQSGLMTDLLTGRIRVPETTTTP